jgi:cytochrome bd-type quinol oxidase subunit 2
MTKIKRLLMSLILLGSSAFAPLSLVAVAGAQTGECLSGDSGGIEECLNNGAVATDPDAADDDPSDQVNDMIRLVINIFSLVVGVISVIMIIIGGLKYITSGGDSGNVSGAKNTILYAIIGLVVVALAQIIVRFVLQSTADAGA